MDNAGDDAALPSKPANGSLERREFPADPHADEFEQIGCGKRNSASGEGASSSLRRDDDGPSVRQLVASVRQLDGSLRRLALAPSLRPPLAPAANGGGSAEEGAEEGAEA